MPFQRFVRLYRNAALLFLNTVLLFLALNGLIWLFGRVDPEMLAYPSPTPQALELPVYTIGPLRHDIEKLRQVHPRKSDQQIIRLLLETANIERVCNADTIFREQPFNGRTVKVDAAGFRWIGDQGPWPPHEDNYNIFVFGGSTTFGYGEADDRTMPSFLQQHLRGLGYSASVYNFGHSGFFSLQERWELERLIRDGFVPDLAIFVDGLNDMYRWDGQARSSCRPDAASPVERWRRTLTCRHDEWCWPVQRLVAHFSELTKPTLAAPADAAKPPPAPPVDDVATNRAIINRWLENKVIIEKIATAHNIQTLFILQPVPGYNHDLTYDPFLNRLPRVGPIARAQWAYPLWEEMVAADSIQTGTTNFLSLTSLGKHKKEPIYVDLVHYTGDFMTEMAEVIANEIVAREMIDDSYFFSCQVVFSAGWHEPEKDGRDWWRWTDGRGQIQVFTEMASRAIMRGELKSIQPANKVDILVNGEPYVTLGVFWDGFSGPPEPLPLELEAGQNIVELVSHSQATIPPTENRPVAIAIKNLSLSLTLASGNYKCEINQN